jgi:hypothetical protein
MRGKSYMGYRVTWLHGYFVTWEGWEGWEGWGGCVTHVTDLTHLTA